MSKEAMKLALDALKQERENYRLYGDEDGAPEYIHEAIKALEEALAKQEQGEPVAFDIRCDNCGGDGYDPKDNNYNCSSCEGTGFLEKLLYTTPQQRKPLTDEQKVALCKQFPDSLTFDAITAIEAAHGIKE